MSMRSSRLLITGATGFLGSRLCRSAIEAGYHVRILCRTTSSFDGLAGLAVEHLVGDITDLMSLRAAVADRDCVVHAAADMNYWRSNPKRQFAVNVGGTRNIAQASREAGIRRLVHVSSVAAIGIPEDGVPANEQFCFNLENSGLDYHISKRRAEESILEETGRGLNAVIVNPSSISGPSRVARLIASVNRSRIVPCFSGGNCVVHVEDVAAGILLALEHGRIGQRYILGGDNLTFRAQAEHAAAALGKTRTFVTIPPIATRVAALLLEPIARVRRKAPRIAHLVHYCANRQQFYNSDKARSELGYRPRTFDTILSEGLQTLGQAVQPASELASGFPGGYRTESQIKPRDNEAVS